MRKSGFTLIELLVVIAIIGILATLAVPNYQRYLINTRVAKVGAELRQIDSALAAYFVDHNEYPMVDHSDSSSGGFGANHNLGPQTSTQALNMPTFRVRENPDDGLDTLTTPISYLPAYFEDPFASSPGVTYNYSIADEATVGLGAVRRGFIIWSYGPDRDERERLGGENHGGDIPVINIGTTPRVDPNFYNPRTFTPDENLIFASYDPTNGTVSGGDLWLIK